MKIHNTQLEAKVSARNRVHQLALEQLPAMLAACAPFVGKQVQNQTGAINAKLKAVLPESNGHPDFQWWYECTRYSLRVNFKVCESSKSRHPGMQFASYAECSATIGDIEGHTLTKLCNGQKFQTDYTVSEVQLWRKEAEQARAKAQEAEHKLAHFGQYDN